MNKLIPRTEEVCYVLLLEGDNIYVGTSTQLHNRLNSHWNGIGAKWTMLHKPVKVIGIHAGGFEKEQQLTLLCRDKYGVEKVRGAGYVSLEPRTTYGVGVVKNQPFSCNSQLTTDELLSATDVAIMFKQ